MSTSHIRHNLAVLVGSMLLGLVFAVLATATT
jgi:hypothetical protein